MARYSAHTPQELQDMLGTLGLSKLEDLYQEIPDELKLQGELNLHQGLSLLDLEQLFDNLASGNMQPNIVLRGAGAYKHFIPPLCKTVPSKESFLSSYTPYQAEASQGVLQSIFEFQTMICELTGMDLANASLYDGAEAAAEASSMCVDKKRSKTLVSAGLNPAYIETIKTYAFGRGHELELIDLKDGRTDLEALKKALEDPQVASVIVQQPNYFGHLEEAKEIGALVKEAGAAYIMCVNPIAQAVLETPKDCHADICVGEGQPLGLALGFGGPYLGFMSCNESYLRKIPGRIVGKTTDLDGKEAFVLTLQAREQHIRREKAGSNVCTNQALCALTAAVYMASMGPQGMKSAAELSYYRAHKLAQRLCSYEGFELLSQGEFFHEFLTSKPEFYAELEAFLAERRILPGLALDEGVLWCATECFTEQQEQEFFEELDAFYAMKAQEPQLEELLKAMAAQDNKGDQD